MYRVGEAILLSLLLGAFLGLFYVAIRMILTAATVVAPPDFLPKEKRLSLPLLGELSVIPPERKRGAFFRFFLVFLFDIFFFLIAGAALSVFVYSVGGIFRLSYLAGAIFGFALFRLTAGRLLFFFWAYLLFGGRVLLSYLVFFFLWPLRPIFRRFSHFFSKSALFFRKRCATIKVQISSRVLMRREIRKAESKTPRKSVSFRFPKE